MKTYFCTVIKLYVLKAVFIKDTGLFVTQWKDRLQVRSNIALPFFLLKLENHRIMYTYTYLFASNTVS